MDACLGGLHGSVSRLADLNRNSRNLEEAQRWFEIHDSLASIENIVIELRELSPKQFLPKDQR